MGETHLIDTLQKKEILDKIEPGDAVMVDRGFNIGDLRLQRGAKLHIPPFTRKKKKGKVVTEGL